MISYFLQGRIKEKKFTMDRCCRNKTGTKVDFLFRA
jgi:hypothetical protein